MNGWKDGIETPLAYQTKFVKRINNAHFYDVHILYSAHFFFLEQL